jgi:UDP-glucose 4-epimerase
LKIALTGGSGQLGTLVLRRLLADRKIKSVVSLDRRPPLLCGGKLRAVLADVRDPTIGQHFEGCDAVIHLAFLVTESAPRELFEAVNVEGSRNVFRAAAEAGARHVLYASSVAAYGVVPGHPVPLTEEAPRRYQPDFAYPATKWKVEELLDAFEKEHPEILVTRLRPSILVGARMEHTLGDVLRHRILPEIGGAPAPMVWDEDVADAFVLALKKGVAGAFNVSAEEPLPAAELAAAAGFRCVKVPRALVHVRARLSPLLARLGLGRSTDPAWVKHDGAVMAPSSAKARAELGWSPRCPRVVDVLRHYARVAPRRLDRRIGAFLRVLDVSMRLRPPMDEMRGLDACVHLNLTGPGGGDVTIRVKDSRLSVRRGAPRPPTSVATLSDSLLLELLAGRADISTAQLTGRVRIEGDPFAGMLLGGIVTGFRKQAEAPGVAGAVPRALSRWFETGGKS